MGLYKNNFIPVFKIEEWSALTFVYTVPCCIEVYGRVLEALICAFNGTMSSKIYTYVEEHYNYIVDTFDYLK